MSVLALLNKTCTIQRPTFTKDSVSGAPKASYVDTAGVRCAIQIMNAREWPEIREAGETFYNVYFVFGQDVRVSDRLKSASGYTNVEFEVTSIAADDAGRGAYTRVTAKTITGKPTR